MCVHVCRGCDFELNADQIVQVERAASGKLGMIILKYS